MDEKPDDNGDEKTYRPLRRGDSGPTSTIVKKTEIIPIAIDKLVHYRNHPFQLYGGERIEKLAEDIEAIGLDSPIRVRLIEGDKYEILSGHNRVEAVTKLG